MEGDRRGIPRPDLSRAHHPIGLGAGRGIWSDQLPFDRGRQGERGKGDV